MTISILSTSGKSGEILAAITRALDEALPPARVPANAQRVSVRIPSVLQARLDRARGQQSLAAYASGLVAAYAMRRKTATQHPTTNSDPIATFRAEQAHYAREIDRRLSIGAIVLAEASTGIGKGRVLARLAGRHPRTILAAPTLKVVNQDLAEYATLRQVCAYAPPRVYLGRTNFASETRTRDRIAEILTDADADTTEAASEEDRIAARQAQIWLDGGAGGACGETQLVRKYLPIGAYLTEDLRAAAPGFPVDEVRLTREVPDDDRGLEAYLAMRAAVHQGDGPVFTTHATLVWDERGKFRAEHYERVNDTDEKQSLLPECDVLLIDEAHQLASFAESAFSVTVALSTLVRTLSTPAIWRHARLVTKAKDGAERIKSLGDTITALASSKDEDADMTDEVRPLMRRLLTHLKPFANIPHTPETACVHDARTIATQIAGGRSDYSVRINTSPVYRYPSLMTGPRSLSKFWATFWTRFDRVVLASATIYIPRATTTYAATQLVMQLGLPKERLQTMPPVIAPWLTQNVELITALDLTLAPPASKSPNHTTEMQTWHERIAERIAELWASARGGTLVLCTGYETIKVLKSLLGPADPNIIAQGRGRFSDAESLFRARFAAGHKPLWLAAANAWTGLDLRQTGVLAEDDYLFTDLIIPRVPLGLEHSRIHQARVAWSPRVEWDRAAMQMRQGLGRLIRAEGLRHRRIAVLDGRIWTTRYKGMLDPIARMLLPYNSDRPNQRKDSTK